MRGPAFEVTDCKGIDRSSDRDVRKTIVWCLELLAARVGFVNFHHGMAFVGCCARLGPQARLDCWGFFEKDDNALVTGALLNYTLKAPNSATATATAKKTEITILIPAGSQLVGALTVANCTPLKSPLTAKPSTVHVTVTCDCLL